MSSLGHAAQGAVSFSSFLQPVDETLRGRAPRHAAVPASPKEEARKRAHEEGFVAGHQEGFLKGLEEGRAQGQAQAFQISRDEESARLESFSQELDLFATELQTTSREWFQTAENDLTELVTSICKQVLASELAIGRESIQSIVREAIKETGLKGAIRLRIHPADRPLMESEIEPLKALFAQITDIKLVNDASFSSGCIIEATNGVVDVTTDSKLAKIDENLRGKAA